MKIALCLYNYEIEKRAKWIDTIYTTLFIHSYAKDITINFQFSNITNLILIEDDPFWTDFKDLYSLYQVNTLKNNYEVNKNFVYDFVVFTNHLKNLPNIQFIKTLDKNKLYIHKDYIVGDSSKTSDYASVFYYHKKFLQHGIDKKDLIKYNIKNHKLTDNVVYVDE